MRDRIKKIMDNEGMSASQFADRLEINRAVISHILNGRNNPSLDVVTKILAEMDYINSDWLLKGEGAMYKDGYSPNAENTPTLFDTDTINRGNNTETEKYAKENASKSDDIDNNTSDKQVVPSTPVNIRKVKQIIIYYDDNTFETFTPH